MGLSGVVRRARTNRGWQTTGQESLPQPRRAGVTIGLPTRLFSWDATRAPSGTGATWRLSFPVLLLLQNVILIALTVFWPYNLKCKQMRNKMEVVFLFLMIRKNEIDF